MKLIELAILAIFVTAITSCATTSETTSSAIRPLIEDFQEAHELMMGEDFDSASIANLRVRLHSRLRRDGDDAFARVLESVPEMEQVSVVNVMGFMNPRDYDRFPKTQYLLSAAPKI